MKKYITVLLLGSCLLNLDAINKKSSKKEVHCCKKEHDKCAEELAHTTGYKKADLHTALAVTEAIDNKDEVTLKKMIKHISHPEARKQAEKALPKALKGDSQARVQVTAPIVRYWGWWVPMENQEERNNNWSQIVCD